MGGIGPLITAMTRHRVAANLMMLIFFLSGAWALTKLNLRFFPEFETNVVSTSVSLKGASSKEIEDSVVVPLENALRSVSDLKKIYSYSQDGSGRVVLEFPDGTDMKKAVKDIKSEVDRVSLPGDSDPPVTVEHKRDENVTKFTIATANRSELHDLARRLESNFNATGIAKVELTGIPEEAIYVEIEERKLIEAGLTLEQVGLAIKAQNHDQSVGSLGGLGNERKVRAASEHSDFQSLYQVPIAGGQSGGTTYLRDIATIRRTVTDDQVEIIYNGLPAVEFQIVNTGTNDIISTAGKVQEWFESVRPTLPDSVILSFHDESWRLVNGRKDLLVDNGISGLALVLLILFLFLSFPVAFWVAAGIPAAMLATLFVFYNLGGTLNMISMFALIMALGIIVDDAIVVGENAQYRLQQGQPPMRAAISAARKMFVPVFASSFTTIASFLPLFLVGGAIGSIIFDIPLIIVCILIAALLECFFILPGHLYHSFAKRKPAKPGLIRSSLDGAFEAFRDRLFRPAITFAVRHALATCMACFMALGLAVGLLANGFVKFRFFPGAELSRLTATVEFTSGTARPVMEDYINTLIGHLDEVELEHVDEKGKLVKHVTAMYGYGSNGNGNSKARVIIELIGPDERDITVQRFANQWRKAIGPTPAGLEKLTMRGQRGGPPGQDIEVEISGSDLFLIKDASLQVQKTLAEIGGIKSISDDTPYGKDEVVFELTPLGRSLGLQIETIARQMRYAIDGFRVQTFTEGVDEVDLKVLYKETQNSLPGNFYVKTPTGQYVQLREVITLRQERGFETILHRFGRNAITITGDLDDDSALSVTQITESLRDGVLAKLSESHGISFSFEGRQSQQQEAGKDMQIGLALALVSIFIILTWVFNSWSIPLVVMITMPLGVIGAIAGHWLLGLTMSILSTFGMFTLMGIIVNNSIVLVRCFQDMGPDYQNAEDYNDKIVNAACQRLRPVLLTSLTTIGGLLPLMFETSLQAQFLIPMAASIVFGLAFATILILFFSPATLSLHGALSRTFKFLHSSKINLPRSAPLKHKASVR